MKKRGLFWVLYGAAVAAFAQTADLETPRRQLQDERKLQESFFTNKEAECYLRFAVTDCLRQVRRERRVVLDKLRRQEVLLNDQERKQKGLEQLEVIREKSSPERLESEALQRAEAVNARKEREQQAQQKADEAAMPRPVQDAPQPEDKALNSGPAKDQALKNKQAFEARLKEAQEHRASREKSLQEKSATPKKPLPVE